MGATEAAGHCRRTPGMRALVRGRENIVTRVWIGSEATRKRLCERGGWTEAPEVIWNQHRFAARKDVSPVLLAATSTLSVSPSDLLAPIVAAAAVLLLRLVGRPAPVWVRRRNSRRR